MSRAKWTKKYNELRNAESTQKAKVVAVRSTRISYYEGLLIRLKVGYTIDKIRRGKYNRDVIHTEDGKFDSGLECYCFYRLKEENIIFDFQVKYVIQERIKLSHENYYIENGKTRRTVAAITLTPDFITHKDDTIYIIDTKGHQTPQNKIRFKMLRGRLAREEKQYKILLPKSATEVEEVIQKLLS